MDLSEFETRKAAINLFKDEETSESVNAISDLPGVDVRVADILKEAGIADVQQFIDAYEEDALKNIEGLTADDIEAVNKIISENVEFVEESDENPAETEAASESDSDEEEYFCPECGAKITLDMTHCPKCGVEFEFEEEEE